MSRDKRQQKPKSYVEAVKKIVAAGFILHEKLQILEDPLLDRHFVVVPNRILAEEVKHDDKRFA